MGFKQHISRTWQMIEQQVNDVPFRTEHEDEYLTNASIHYHEHLGYRMVGWFTNCGYKFHRWYNLAWMEKEIGEHVADQPPVIAFTDIVEDISLQNGELRL